MRSLGAPLNRRTLVFLAFDLVVFATSLFLAVGIRYGDVDDVPTVVRQAVGLWLLLSIPIKVVANVAFRIYGITWEFIADRDILAILSSTAIAAAAWGLVAHGVSGVADH